MRPCNDHVSRRSDKPRDNPIRKIRQRSWDGLEEISEEVPPPQPLLSTKEKKSLLGTSKIGPAPLEEMPPEDSPRCLIALSLSPKKKRRSVTSIVHLERPQTKRLFDEEAAAAEHSCLGDSVVEDFPRSADLVDGIPHAPENMTQQGDGEAQQLVSGDEREFPPGAYYVRDVNDHDEGGSIEGRNSSSLTYERNVGVSQPQAIPSITVPNHPDPLAVPLAEVVREKHNEEMSFTRRARVCHWVFIIAMFSAFAWAGRWIAISHLRENYDNPPPQLEEEFPAALFVASPKVRIYKTMPAQHLVDECESHYSVRNFPPAIRACLCKKNFDVPDANVDAKDADTTVDATVVDFNYNTGAGFDCLELTKRLGTSEKLQDGTIVLRALFEAWTGGDPDCWKDSTHWLSINKCIWYGVTCDEMERITELRLPDNNLLPSGGIPTELYLLTDLKVLDLSSNGLQISITSGMSQLTSLEILNLSENPVQWALSAFSYFPESLKSIHLSSTWLYGSIPTKISQLANSSRLEVLDISGSQLSGSLPSELFLISSLRQLVLSQNRFTGGIPSGISSMTHLENLDFSDNMLMRTHIPPEMGQLTALADINLNKVKGIGLIPTELGRLTNLRTLQLAGQSDVEKQDVHLQGINEVVLSSGFRGPIPTEIGRLSKLEVLQLQNNAFRQQIPSQLGQLVALEFFDLSYNLFTGSIPEEISGLTNLKVLRLRGAHTGNRTFANNGKADHPLAGRFPIGLAELKSLYCLDTAGTTLTGTIPEALCSTGFRHVNVECSSLTLACSCCICSDGDYCALVDVDH